MTISPVTSFSGTQQLNTQTAQLNAQTKSAQNLGSAAHEAMESPAEEAMESQVRASQTGNTVNTLV